MSLKVRAATIAAASLLTLGVAVGAAPIALADTTVSGCTYHPDGACVAATTGSKVNGTQWVGWVNASGQQNGVIKLEAWGDGFYFATPADPNTWHPSQQWGAQRWVQSGTNVCGAITYQDGHRDIACISIRA